MRYVIWKALIAAMFIVLPASGWGVSGITYSGRILDSAGVPVEASSVRFTLTVYEPTGKCWLYTEQRELNLTGTNGTFSLEIGSSDASLIAGTAVFNGSVTGPQNLSDLFNNVKTFNGLGGANGCTGTYIPNPSDLTAGRILSVLFSVDNGPNQALPALNINPVPSALQAYSVNGFGSGDLLKVNPTDVAASSFPNAALNQAQYEEFWKLILGTSATYLKTIPALGGDITGTLPAVSVDKIKGVAVTAPVGGDNGKVLTYDSAGAGSLKWTTPAAGGITSVNGETGAAQSFASGTAALTINSAANTHTLSISNATSSANGLLTSADWSTFNSKQSALGYTPVNKAGDTMAGDLLMGGNKITGLTNVPNVAANPAVGENGKSLRWNNGANQWEWFTASAAGAGITSLNSQSGNSQSFGAIDLGTSVTAPAWSSASDVHTLKIPMASDTGVTAGLLSKADHTSFSGKLTSPLTTKGDLLSRDGTTHVRLPVGADNYVLTADSTQASGLKWAAIPAGGITSLNGLSSSSQTFAIGTSGNFPAFASSTNTHTLNIPLASASGTVTAGLLSNAEYVALNNKMSNSLAAGQIWVGNSSNGAQARALSGDISSVTDTGLVTATKTTAGLANTLVSTDGTGVINSFGVGLKGSVGGTVTLSSITGTTANYNLKFPATAPAAGQALQSDASGNLSWFDPGSATAQNATSSYSVRASTAGANITLSGTQTIDGVALIDGDRVLVRNQSNYAENGVYVVSSGAWTRATDLDTWAKTVGYQATVKEGTLWAGMRFLVNSSASGTIDSSAMYFNPLGGSNQLGSNAGVGHLALWGNTTGSSNNAFGWGALQFSTTGSANIAFGSSSLRWNKTGNNNVAVGSSALSENVAKHESTAIGYRSMYRADSTSTASVSYNTAVGAYSLQGSSTAGFNTGTKNTAIGHSSLMATTSGSSNTAVGNYTGATLTTGSGNIFIGNNSGSAVTTGSNNVIIGSHTGSTIATSSNNILIADGAGNQRIIVDSTGKVGIGGSPTYNLDVVGDINVTGNFKINGTNISTGGGITSLNGLSSGSQTFAVGTSGNSPAFASATNTHTLNIPMASSAGTVTAGLISNAEYVALNSKMSSSLGAGKLWVGNASSIATEVAVSGDATLTNAGVLTLKNTGTVGTYTKVVTDTQGRVASGSAMTSADITTSLGYTPVNKAGDTMSGNLRVYRTNANASMTITSDNTSTNTARYPQVYIENFMGSPGTSNGGSPAVVLVNYRGNSSSTAAMRAEESLGSVVFGGSKDTSGNYAEGASIWATSTQAFSATAAGTRLEFMTTSPNTTTQATRMTINDNGSVGIGTLSPSSILHVAGAGNPVIKLQDLSNLNTANTFASWISGQDSAGAETWWVGEGSNTGKTVGLTAPLAGYEVKMSNSVGSILINSSGDTGIGTLSPGAILDVQARGSNVPLMLRNTTYAGSPWIMGPDLANAFVIYNNSNVGAYISNGATTWTSTSDIRMKKNFLPLDHALEKIQSISGMTYHYKTDADTDPRRVGVIAQDVQKVLPEAISERDGILGVKYTELIPLVINATKELYAKLVKQDRDIALVSAQVQKLESDNAAKDEKIKELEERLERLEKSLNSK